MRILTILLALVLVMTACSSDSQQPTDSRPDSPAGDDFRSDAAKFVANTGKPQLVEFFSYT